MIRHLFVYGTLRPGDVRWHFIEPFVVGEGALDTVAGELFDTGQDYPAAVFALTGDEPARGTIHGHTFELAVATIEHCLEVLDEEEDTVAGLYRRVEIRTGLGLTAWAYEYGTGLDLTPIPSGDWMLHRPFPPRHELEHPT
jgi:gamma-glutamylcyclotransferase (GGCT)/AIG2-like uncharacterized protein YtfP